LQFGTASNARATIDSSGNVGIGTTSPASKLNIAGSAPVLTISDTNLSGQATIKITDASNNAYTISRDTSTGFLVNNGTQSIYAGYIWQTNSTERMRIDNSGNLLVGTTSAQAKFVTNSATSGASAKVITSFSGDVSTAALILQKNDNNTTTSQILAQFLINGGSNGSGQINANGASSAAFGAYSDERLKENIVDLPSQLANICALRPVEFDYIASEGGGHQIGFVAQEMQTVYPDVVGEREDGMLMITGWSKTEARLVKALQEAVAKIDAQAADIAALKAKVGV
jgi:hypothetical protein